MEGVRQSVRQHSSRGTYGLVTSKRLRTALSVIVSLRGHQAYVDACTGSSELLRIETCIVKTKLVDFFLLSKENPIIIAREKFPST